MLCPRAQVVLLAATVCAYNTWAPKVLWRLVVSPVPHTLLGAALSLLLVFRTNSSYTRFIGEGRGRGGMEAGWLVSASTNVSAARPEDASVLERGGCGASVGFCVLSVADKGEHRSIKLTADN